MRETAFLCPLCSNSICTQCQEFYHYGMSCNLNKLCKGDSDYSLKMWLQADPNNHKSCPSCSAPIEKNGGCNHMTCWKCKCDMCWLCLQVFPNAELVVLKRFTSKPFLLTSRKNDVPPPELLKPLCNINCVFLCILGKFDLGERN
ncbi:ATP-dependent RNA helicase DEAH12, chloroplastic [Caerostris extrusa]|uniref:ATP-dependent RNA helicase DEAH12, chloroplastic n=1 Tax=Caerostris extrusa TaxID=172846 RepID=A0AAV4SWB7_CAEEX|nr:ATP-dependent RNA helicase DEAH12, chloroplastic [Caerostris extrusa]